MLLPGEDGFRRSNHRFTFPFFKISTNQVHRINCILLDNAHLTSVIAFDSELSLKGTLEYYLQLPVDQGYKVIHRGDNDAKLVYLKKLELVTKSLGSTVVISYKEILEMDDMEISRQQSLRRIQEELLKNVPE